MDANVDLFDNLSEQPEEIQELFNEVEELDYYGCEVLLAKCQELGYTFDYYLDAQPYNLRKL